MNSNLRLLKASIEFLCRDDGVVWWGLHSHFRVPPNYCVEVVLRLYGFVVGVVTIVTQRSYIMSCVCQSPLQVDHVFNSPRI